jgi:hypothetical protein
VAISVLLAANNAEGAPRFRHGRYLFGLTLPFLRAGFLAGVWRPSTIAEAIARRRPCTVASLTAESTVQELRDQSDFGKAIFFQEIVQPFASCAPAVVRGRPWLRSNVSYSLC